jgi:hypothetical protein
MSDGAFFGYIAMLFISGTMMTVFAVGGFGLRPGSRLGNGLFGPAFLAYAVYLLFFFEGGEVFLSFWAFLAPVFAVAGFVRTRRDARRLAEQQQFVSSRPPIHQEYGTAVAQGPAGPMEHAPSQSDPFFRPQP